MWLVWVGGLLYPGSGFLGGGGPVAYIWFPFDVRLAGHSCEMIWDL